MKKDLVTIFSAHTMVCQRVDIMSIVSNNTRSDGGRTLS